MSKLRLREKLLIYGPDSLSDTELLSLVLGTGTKKENVRDLAQRLLTQNGGLRGLARVDIHALIFEKGIGHAKAARIIGIFALAKRLTKERGLKKLYVYSPKDVFDLLSSDLEYSSQERFIVICLDTKNRVVKIQEISKGSTRSAIVNPSDVFAYALYSRAVSIIVVHNHPSGDPLPSKEDICITERLKKAGNLIGVEVLDHIIIGERCFVSIAENPNKVQNV